MIKNIKSYIENIFIRFFINFKKYEKIYFNPEELNFSLINFIDQKKIKSIYLNINSLNVNIQNKNSQVYHSFDWLNYSKKLGGANNIKRANQIIESWIDKHRSINSPLWSVDFVSSRYINIVYALDFLSILFDQKLKEKIYRFLYLHYWLLKNQLNYNNKKYKIQSLKALLLGNCIYKRGIKKSLKLLNNLFNDQIDSFGFHKSYNALEHSRFINDLHEIKNIFLFFQVPKNKILLFQINNMTAVIQNLFHHDKSLILFNGSRNTNLKEVNKVINLSKDIIPKKIDSNEEGLVFFKDNEKSIFMDIVRPINETVNSSIHASTLAFELSCKGEKIITNCGSIDRGGFIDDDYLRYSAAHSTIILNNTNISELNRNKSYRRVPNKITFNKEDQKGYILWNSGHNGYINNFNKIVSRKIKIIKNKNEIIGEDSFMSTKSNTNNIIYHIRFHLMPHCNCILTNNKKNAILQINKQSWTFKTSSLLSIEDSIYVNNENKIQQTKQIVISGHVSSRKKIEYWKISKHE